MQRRDTGTVRGGRGQVSALPEVGFGSRGLVVHPRPGRGRLRVAALLEGGLSLPAGECISSPT